MKYLLLLISVLIVCAGCGKREEAVEVATVEETKEAAIVDPATAATISGTVSFEGEAPARKELPFKGNPECAALAHGGIFSEDLLSKDGKLQNAVVYVKEGLENAVFDPPKEAVVIDNTNCVYVPHMSAAQVNQPVTFLNNDPTLHNIHSFPKNQPGFNMGLPFQGMKQTKKFSKAEIAVPLKCDVHPWMLGYVAILPHPYFAVTGEDGVFSIKNLPPGKYVLEAWHETLGTKTLPVTVRPSESKQASFTFKK